MISVWNSDKFLVSSQWYMEGAVVVNGVWVENDTTCCIVNVYAPCLADAKRDLWDRIEMVVSQNSDVCTCVIGDFNSIAGEGERVGIAEFSSRMEICAFIDFIRNSGLLDLDIHGRKFTWYRANGTCKIRIDRAMINDKWLEKWPCSFLRGLPRTVSDHCAIVVDTKSTEWVRSHSSS